MTSHLNLRPHAVHREDRADGCILLTAAAPLGKVPAHVGAWLRHWANLTPDQVLFAERSGNGWRRVSYIEAFQAVEAIGAALLDQGLQPQGAPILILSGNSVDHALLSLAAHDVGIVTVPVAEQYALIPAAHARLKYVIDLVKPALVFASDAAAYADAIALAGVPAICTEPARSNAIRFSDLLLGGSADAGAARAAVGPDTVAKVLLTSGSTSDPKGVLTTQRMMTANQVQIADCLPFLRDRPPVLVDWLPWNHVFGGSHNFNMVIANGGSLYIDDGKPLPALFPRTLENLGLQSGTISFNVPVGFAQLVNALQKDEALARTYFRDLDMIFYAGASLPQETWTALEDLARKHAGHLPLITSSWGLTETAPAALLQHEPARGAGIVGVPLPGVTIKLIDDGDGRMDVRVRGDNIFDGYLNNPAKTAEAFDEDGFFVTGDAMRFVDPDDMDKGLKFDGRTSEDFKLMTGTWVQAANLRLKLLGALAPFAADIAVAGAGRGEIGVLIVPNRAAIEAAGHELSENGPVCVCETLFSELRARLDAIASTATGSAHRVTRALILAEPPSMAEGEMTAKGNINFPKFFARRAVLVDRLYDNSDPASIVISDDD